jgi:hypothetical protein
VRRRLLEPRPRADGGLHRERRSFINQAHIDRIIVEGGRATGVELAGGRTLRASQFVASTVDVNQTFQEMVGPDQLPATSTPRWTTHHYTPWALYGVHLALNEAPRYTSTDFDPNVNRAMKQNIGSETLEQLMGVHRRCRTRRSPPRSSIGAGPPDDDRPDPARAGTSTPPYAWHVVP